MKKVLKVLLVGGHVIAFLKDTEEEAKSYRDRIRELMDKAAEHENVIWITMGVADFLSSCIVGFDIVDDVPPPALAMQKEFVDLIRKQIKEERRGDDWRSDDEEGE